MKDLYNRANDIANHTTNAEQQHQLSIDRDIVRFRVIYGLLGKLQHGKQPIVTISGYTNKQNVISALENVYGSHTNDIFNIYTKGRFGEDMTNIYLKEDWFTSYVPTGPRKIKVPKQVLWFKYMSSIYNPKLNAADRLYYLLRGLGNQPDDRLDNDEDKILTVAAEQSIDKGKTQREGFDGLGKFILFSKLYWYNPWFFIIKNWAESQLNVSFKPTVNDIWELKIYEEGVSVWDF